MTYQETFRKGLADHLRSHAHQRGIIVCEERQFIYLKAGKTAGTSILREGLQPRINETLIMEKDTPDLYADWLSRIWC